jgi:hypothetical protein
MRLARQRQHEPHARVTGCAPAAVCPGLLWAVTVEPRAPDQHTRDSFLESTGIRRTLLLGTRKSARREARRALAKTDQLHWLALYR